MAVKAKPVGQKARAVLWSVTRLRETDSARTTPRFVRRQDQALTGSRAWLAGVCDRLTAYIDDAHAASRGLKI
jgi:hypothetical protein